MLPVGFRGSAVRAHGCCNGQNPAGCIREAITLLKKKLINNHNYRKRNDEENDFAPVLSAVFRGMGQRWSVLHERQPETDISIAKEVLTISIGDDGYARVDVQYEFMNNGKAKEVQMGFEANAPYNDAAPMNKDGRHPYIHDFTVTMNGQVLDYSNAVVAFSYEGTDFKPLDLDKWKSDDNLDWNQLKEEGTDSIIPFSYAYIFRAPFKEGLNTVHHTYRYMMSFGIGRTFEVPYWLKPAMRWANHRIDDFTLRIKAENTAKHFCLENTLFGSSTFRVTEGTGKPAESSAVHVGGKTGTAQVARKGKYVKGLYNSSFIGFWPANDPKYTMLIVFGDVTGKVYYGGALAAPVFKQVVDEVERLKGIGVK